MDSVTRRNLGYAVLGLFLIFALLKMSMVSLLFGAGVSLIAFGANFPLELGIAVLILSALVFQWIVFGISPKQSLGLGSEEGFTASTTPYGMGNAEQITSQIRKLEQGYKFSGPKGILPGFVEGFANAEEEEESEGFAESEEPELPEEKEGFAEEEEESEGFKDGATANSTPASPGAPTASATMKKGLPLGGALKKVKAALPSKKATTGEFKLGSIPSDAKDGPHIDIGTTMMQALNSLKPDQIKAMTNDTKQLLETQKSLMGMLTSLKPMLSDGKQMMETFTEMFGSTNGPK